MVSRLKEGDVWEDALKLKGARQILLNMTHLVSVEPFPHLADSSLPFKDQGKAAHDSSSQCY